MLKIRYVNPTGMFSYGQSHNIDVEDRGLVNLLGVNEDKGNDSNGSGKSSLFNAVCEILYDENPTKVSGNGVINQIWKRGFAGRVEFISWEGVYYRVTSCRDWKDDFYPVDANTKIAYKKTALYFEKYEDGWKDLRGASISETRKLILKALGITYNRFISVAYLSHRTGSRFLRGTKSERIDILEGITGIEEWDDILSQCRARKTKLQNENIAIQEKIAFEKGSLQELIKRKEELDQTDWVAQAKDYEDQISAKNTEIQKLETIIQEKTQRLETLQKDQKSVYESGGVGILTQEIADLTLKAKQYQDAHTLESSLPQFDPIIEQAIYTLQDQVSTKKGEISYYLRKGDLRKKDNCPTCGASISAGMKAEIQSTVDALQQEVQSLQVQHKQAKGVWEQHQHQIQLDRAAAYEARQHRVTDTVTLIQEKQKQLEGSKLEYERVTGEIQQLNTEIDADTRDQVRCKQDIKTFQYWVEQASQNIEVLTNMSNSIVEKENIITSLETGISNSLSDIEVYVWLIQNIPYIKLHRLSVTMLALSERVNKYLDEMGDSTRVYISSFEEKKSAKGAADTKDMLKSEVKLEVVDGEKNIDPRLYSDGETSKISNAIIRALHDMAMSSGHGCNVIMLDEIFAFVDMANSQKLVDSFQNFSTGTTLVTDNSGYVNDLLSFNETWVATKRDGLTTLGVRR